MATTNKTAVSAATKGPVEPPKLVELQAIEPLRLGVAKSVEDIALGARFSVQSDLADELVTAGLACWPLPPVLPEA